jgi:hypothetical protein
MKKAHGSEDKLKRSQLISAVFQLRHRLVHNLGVVTESDATKLRQILQAPINGKKVLSPSSKNVKQVKSLLDETARQINERMSLRLSELLSTLQQGNYLSIDPASKAKSLATLFGVSVTVSGHTASP